MTRTERLERFKERFLAKVDRSGGPDACHMWTGPTKEDGYGSYRGRNAHRQAWIIENGPVPDGLSVCHSCDERYPRGDKTYRRCCNTRHHFLGTHAENMADMARKNRAYGKNPNSDENRVAMWNAPPPTKRDLAPWIDAVEVPNIREIQAAMSRHRPTRARAYAIYRKLLELRGRPIGRDAEKKEPTP